MAANIFVAEAEVAILALKVVEGKRYQEINFEGAALTINKALNGNQIADN